MIAFFAGVSLLATALLAAGTWLSYRGAVRRRQAASAVRLKTLVCEGDIASRAGGGPRQATRIWLPRRLQVAMARADLHLTARHAALGLAAVVATALAALALSGPSAAALAVMATTAGAWWGLERAGERRRQQCIDALPAFLDGIRQLVKVGNSLMQAVQKATDTAPPAVARYFAPTAMQVSHGAPLGDSIAALADRLDMAEIHMFAAAVQSNLRFGGRIGHILANLVRILRDRRQVEREIAAHTAETRSSALVLGALPFLAGGWIAFQDPAYAAFFLDDPVGRHILSAALPMQVIGLLAMRRIVGVSY